MVVRMVPFSNKRLAYNDYLKWPIVRGGGKRGVYEHFLKISCPLLLRFGSSGV